MNQRFDDLKASLKDMVSKGEFEATIARLDGRDDQARRDIDTIATTSTRQHAEMAAAAAHQHAEMTETAKTEHAELVSMIDSFRRTQWKIAGVITTALGLIFSAAQVILALTR